MVTRMTRRSRCAMTLLLLAGALLAMGHISANAIDCDTLPPRPGFDFVQIGSFHFNEGNDCWGWVAPDGTEWAIYGEFGSVKFLNVTNMQTMRSYPGPDCIWRDMKTYRHYCYVVLDCDAVGMQIIDMQYLADSLHFVGSLSIGSSGRSFHNLSIDTARGFAYLEGNFLNSVYIVDLADPESPVHVGNIAITGGIHDMYARNDTVWVAEGYNQSFSIWDVADKNSPVMLSRVEIPGNGYVHNIWPTDDGRYAVTTEETSYRTVKIWNTEDLGNIFLVSEYLGPSGLAHNAHVEGNLLFLSHYESGFSILDITYPECPVEVGLFDTYPQSQGPSFNGCWGIYPHAKTGRFYASTIEGDLLVFRMDTASAEFTATPQVGMAPLSVDFNSSGVGTQVAWDWGFGDGDSGYVPNPTHIYDPGVYSVGLTITTISTSATEIKSDYIIAAAETLSVAPVSEFPDSSFVMGIDLINHFPISEFRLPIRLSDVPASATIDSVSIVGTRLDDFEFQQIIFNNIAGGELVLRLKADNGGGTPPLVPGSGTIAKLYGRLSPAATPGDTLTLSIIDTIGSYPPSGITASKLFPLFGGSGELTVLTPDCYCACHSDPQCDGIVDVLDVIATVDVAFRDVSSTFGPVCPNADTDHNCDDITNVFDVIAVIDVAFRDADPASTFCVPCP